MQEEEKDRIKKAFLKRLGVQFTSNVGKAADQKRYLAEVSRQVSKFSTPVLERAVDLILQQSKSVRWPAVAVLYKACVVARAEIEPETAATTQRRRAIKPGRLPEPVAIEIALKSDHLSTLKAVEGGWHGRFIDYVREHRALPDAQEQERLCLETVEKWREWEQSEAATVPGSIVVRSMHCLAAKRANLAADINRIFIELQERGALDGKAQDEEASF